MSNSLQPYGLQHARLPCPSPSPRVCSKQLYGAAIYLKQDSPILRVQLDGFTNIYNHCYNQDPENWHHPKRFSCSFAVSFISLIPGPRKPLSITVILPFLASGSFPMSQFFASGAQSIGASVSASVLPMNIQDWFPLGLTGFISLLSKRLSRVFSNTTVWKHQFFSAQPSLWSNS